MRSPAPREHPPAWEICSARARGPPVIHVTGKGAHSARALRSGCGRWSAVVADRGAARLRGGALEGSVEHVARGLDQADVELLAHVLGHVDEVLLIAARQQ